MGRFAVIEMICVATPNYADKWAFCIRSQQQYAERHGYDYDLCQRPVPGLHAKWAKIQFVIDALAAGKDVLMIDADAQIRRNCPGLAGLLEMPGDIFFALGASGRLNSGVMLFRGGTGSVAKAYLEACLDRRDIPVDEKNFVTTEGENGHLIEIIEHPEFAARAVTVSRNWNLTVPDGMADALILHYTGSLRRALIGGKAPYAAEARTLRERLVAAVEVTRVRISRKRTALMSRLSAGNPVNDAAEPAKPPASLGMG